MAYLAPCLQPLNKKSHFAIPSALGREKLGGLKQQKDHLAVYAHYEVGMLTPKGL